MSGTGIAGVNINLIYLDTQKYTPHWGTAADQNSSVLKFTTVYNLAFRDFLNTTMRAADPFATVTSAWAGTTYSVTLTNGGTQEMKFTDSVLADKSHKITLQVTNTGTLTLNRAFVQVDINV
jgi:hypothetical protein